MKKPPFLIITLFCAAAFAQDLPQIAAGQNKDTVAVYMAGEEPKGALGSHKILGGELEKAISRSKNYIAVNRTEDVLDAIAKEHDYTRSGAVNDTQIKKIGEQLGVQYLCIVEISAANRGYYVAARLVDVESARIVNSSSTGSRLEDYNEQMAVAQRIARELTNVDLETGYKPASERPKTYTITAAAKPSYAGTVSRKPYYATYYPGTQVVLAALPNEGYMFTGWSGASSSASDTITITVDDNVKLTANFLIVPKPVSRGRGLKPTPSVADTQPKPKPYEKQDSLRQKPRNRNSIGAGGFLANDFGGGLKFKYRQYALPYYGGGGYLYIDFAYSEFLAGLSRGGGNDKNMPDLQRTYINLGAYLKYPLGGENIKFFPLLGLDYEASIFAKNSFSDGEELFDGKRGGLPKADALNALWLKFGGGLDIGMGRNAYLRTELTYGLRRYNQYEKLLTDNAAAEKRETVKTRLGHGFTFKTGVGLKF